MNIIQMINDMAVPTLLNLAIQQLIKNPPAPATWREIPYDFKSLIVKNLPAEKLEDFWQRYHLYSDEPELILDTIDVLIARDDHVNLKKFFNLLFQNIPQQLSLKSLEKFDQALRFSNNAELTILVLATKLRFLQQHLSDPICYEQLKLTLHHLLVIGRDSYDATTSQNALVHYCLNMLSDGFNGNKEYIKKVMEDVAIKVSSLTSNICRGASDPTDLFALSNQINYIAYFPHNSLQVVRAFLSSFNRMSVAKLSHIFPTVELLNQLPPAARAPFLQQIVANLQRKGRLISYKEIFFVVSQLVQSLNEEECEWLVKAFLDEQYDSDVCNLAVYTCLELLERLSIQKKVILSQKLEILIAHSEHDDDNVRLYSTLAEYLANVPTRVFDTIAYGLTLSKDFNYELAMRAAIAVLGQLTLNNRLNLLGTLYKEMTIVMAQPIGKGHKHAILFQQVVPLFKQLSVQAERNEFLSNIKTLLTNGNAEDLCTKFAACLHSAEEFDFLLNDLIAAMDKEKADAVLSACIALLRFLEANHRAQWSEKVFAKYKEVLQLDEMPLKGYLVPYFTSEQVVAYVANFTATVSENDTNGHNDAMVLCCEGLKVRQETVIRKQLVEFLVKLLDRKNKPILNSNIFLISSLASHLSENEIDQFFPVLIKSLEDKYLKALAIRTVKVWLPFMNILQRQLLMPYVMKSEDKILGSQLLDKILEPEAVAHSAQYSDIPPDGAELYFVINNAITQYSSWVLQLKNGKKQFDAGFFSNFRHGHQGLARINRMKECLQSNSEDFSCVSEFFHDELKDDSGKILKGKTRAHNHSFISFLLNELKNADPKLQKQLGLSLMDVEYTKPQHKAARIAALEKLKHFDFKALQVDVALGYEM